MEFVPELILVDILTFVTPVNFFGNSSFLIRILEEKPKRVPKIPKELTSTVYSYNYSSKNKKNYNPFNTNYSQNLERPTFSIEKSQISKGNNKGDSKKENWYIIKDRRI